MQRLLVSIKNRENLVDINVIQIYRSGSIVDLTSAEHQNVTFTFTSF